MSPNKQKKDSKNKEETEPKTNSTSTSTNDTPLPKTPPAKKRSPLKPHWSPDKTHTFSQTMDTDQKLHTAGCLGGVQLLFATKGGKGCYTYGIEIALKPETPPDTIPAQFKKGGLLRAVTRRAAPNDNRPMDSLKPVSQATRDAMGPTYFHPDRAFIRVKLDPKSNTTESREKFGRVNADGWNQLTHASKTPNGFFKYPAIFSYSGDWNTPGQDYYPMAYYITDEDTMECMKAIYREYTDAELARDHEILALFFSRHNIPLIATRLDPTWNTNHNNNNNNNSNNYTNGAFVAGFNPPDDASLSD